MIRSTILGEALVNAGCKSICVKVRSAGRQMLMRQRGSGRAHSSDLLIKVVKTINKMLPIQMHILISLFKCHYQNCTAMKITVCQHNAPEYDIIICN